jgi:two-component system sensor histidine kinase UhpB
LERTKVVCEYRVRRYDGAYRWLIGQGIPRFSAEGEFLGQAGSAVDITDRLNAEQALRAELERRTEMERELHVLSERLIHAQEQARRNIAHELHDDLGQRVAAQGYALFNLKRKLPEISPEAQEAIRRLEESIAKLGADIRDLSHRLHPATLEHAGLKTALKALAAEFSAAGLNVAARLDGAEQSLPAEVELNLFRFAQEALQNVARHAGIAEAEVDLTQENGYTRLRISDRGVGFDPDAQGRQGLGLISMRERARLLRGSLILESAPNQGTTILLEIPSD